MLLVDTNVLIDAANADSEFHGPCLRWLEHQRRQSGAWYTTWPVLYEFLRVSTHPRVMQRPWSVKVAWQFVTALLASPGIDLLVPTDKHSEIASQVIAEIPQLGGNLMHDAHTAILMREHGIKRICTRDMDFRRFPFLEIVDPSREER